MYYISCVGAVVSSLVTSSTSGIMLSSARNKRRERRKGIKWHIPRTHCAREFSRCRSTKPTWQLRLMTLQSLPLAAAVFRLLAATVTRSTNPFIPVLLMPGCLSHLSVAVGYHVAAGRHRLAGPGVYDAIMILHYLHRLTPVVLLLHLFHLIHQQQALICLLLQHSKLWGACSLSRPAPEV